VLYAF
jgi:hypothetical protein